MFKKYISQKIKDKLFQINEVISVTIVGSFNDRSDLQHIGDIDVVVILNKINKKNFNKCNKKINSLNDFILKKTKKSILINNTLGPIKYDYNKFTVIHLMIYDKKSHKKHVLLSPFTCFDWERSKNYKGLSLKEIYPVRFLILEDFISSRRSPNDYIKDIDANSISYRKYYFNKSGYYLKKLKYKFNEINKINYAYHIIKNLLFNYYKFENNINKLISSKEQKKLFLKITNNKNLYNEFIKIKSYRSIKKNNIEQVKEIVIKFLNHFNNFIITIKKNNEIVFIRHNKTLYNDGTFFGQGRDTNKITVQKNKLLIKKKFDICFSSPLKRALETSKIYSTRKIIKINELKEINYGRAEGLNLTKLKKKYPKIIDMWNSNLDPRFPSGENNKDVIDRLQVFLKKLTSNKKFYNKKILVVTHNVLLRSLLGSVFDMKIHEWYKIQINFSDFFEFLIINKKIIPNISRIKLEKLTKSGN